MLFLPQLCVSKCPDRFSSLLDAWNTKNWDYYKQFCKPGFKTGQKVRDSRFLSLFAKEMESDVVSIVDSFRKEHLTQNRLQASIVRLEQSV